ncbi:MAG: thiamine-phosphate kinase [Brevinema sp.]
MRSEKEIIARLQSVFSAEIGQTGIGDDAAILENGQLISTDAVSDGVHFLSTHATWQEVAYKLFASNGSDMAAMGGRAESYFLNLGIPHNWTDNELDSFIEGIELFLKDHPAVLLGGDTVRCPVFFASVTVLGHAFGKPWLRTGAKTGDNIYVTGTLGDSRLYLHHILEKNQLPLEDLDYFRRRHYQPTPRSEWAKVLSQTMSIHASMDISDGLVEDLSKLCGASKCCFHLKAEHLPLNISKIGKKNSEIYYQQYLTEALIGGEDYELIIISPDEPDQAQKQGVALTKIGQIIDGDANTIQMFDKTYDTTYFKGYSHS